MANINKIKLSGTTYNIEDSGAQRTLSAGTGIDITDNVISATGGGGTVDQTIISGSTNAVAGGAVYNKFDEVEEVTAAGLNALNESLNGKADTTAFTAHTADTTIHVTSSDKASWNGAVTALGGLNLVKLSQSEYDALSPNYDSNTLYVIVN